MEISFDWHPPGLSLTPAHEPSTLQALAKALELYWGSDNLLGGDTQGASGYKACIVAEAAHIFAHLNESTLTGHPAIQSSPPSSTRCQDPRAVWLQRGSNRVRRVTTAWCRFATAPPPTFSHCSFVSSGPRQTPRPVLSAERGGAIWRSPIPPDFRSP